MELNSSSRSTQSADVLDELDRVVLLNLAEHMEKGATARNGKDSVDRIAYDENELSTPASSAFDPNVIWQMVLSELALQIPPTTFDTWVRNTDVIAYEDGEFIIGIPNAYARDWLENRLRNNIKRTLSSIMHRSVQVKFLVRSRPVIDSFEQEPPPLYQVTEEQRVQSAVQAATNGTDRFNSQLNPNNTFESFIVGNHNRLAHAAALAVVDSPGRGFNPLFVYGGTGLGKTHLLNAIGNSARQRGYTMIYCSSEQFTNELISSIRNHTTEQFRDKYRAVDILLIDDIQFIGGKESTQEEFFHTFNHLHASTKQVVLSSDRPPKALATLEERLRSRFEGGLQTDISKPDFETRVAILQSKANRMGVPVQYDVLMMVAERVDSNIRELEGALNRICMQARLTGIELTTSYASSVLEDLAPRRVSCSPDEVIRIVAEHYSLTSDDIVGRKRTKDIAYARQIVMYLLRNENDMSLPAIGDQLGGRDHSTIRYGVERISDDLDQDDALRQNIMTLRDKMYIITI